MVDRPVRIAIVIFVLIVALMLALALYGWLTGRWEIDDCGYGGCDL